MKKIQLKGECKLSRIVHGQWRLKDWGMTKDSHSSLIDQLVTEGITSFDHADIYGDYDCEALFGKIIKGRSAFREKIELISKCGIKLKSEKFPNRKIKHYDYSKDEIVNAVTSSLKNLCTDYLDLLLLHRPSPFFDPADVAQTLMELKKEGKVRYFGVSNFNPMQFEQLQSYLDFDLVTNQVEISPLCLDHFENGNIDFFLKSRIKPMAWSPLAGGKLFDASTEHIRIIHTVSERIQREIGASNVAQVYYAWLLNHPAQIIPIVGSGKMERINDALIGTNLRLSTEQWFEIYTAATGKNVP